MGNYLFIRHLRALFFALLVKVFFIMYLTVKLMSKQRIHVYWLLFFVEVFKGFPSMFCVPKVVLLPVLLTLTLFHSMNNFCLCFLLVMWSITADLLRNNPELFSTYLSPGKFSAVPWLIILSECVPLHYTRRPFHNHQNTETLLPPLHHLLRSSMAAKHYAQEALHARPRVHAMLDS